MTSILWQMNFNPTWMSSLFLGIPAICLVIHLCGTHYVPLQERHNNNKKKKARSRRPKPLYVFRRRKFPYHLILLCYAKKGNRPEHIFGPRQELLLVQRLKRRRYCRKRTIQNMQRFYEALIYMASTGRFYLHEPYISLIEATTNKLGPGGIPLPFNRGILTQFSCSHCS